MLKRLIKIVIMILSSGLSIYADHLLQLDNSVLDRICSSVFMVVTVTAGIWVSCYLLFFQLYKNRYPITIIKKKYLPQMLDNFMYVLYSIIFGCIIIGISHGFISDIWFSIISLSIIIEILYQIFKTYQSLMINTYIDDFCNNISQQLNTSNGTISDDTLKDVKYILDESIVKEEYFVAQNITCKMGSVFRDFLENSIKMISHGKLLAELETSYKKIIEINIRQLEQCKKINSSLLIESIIKQNRYNILFCIDTNQFEWYKEYLEELNILTFKMLSDTESKLVNEIFNIYTSISIKLIDSNKEDWIKYLNDNLFSISTSLNFINQNINLKYFAKFLVSELLQCQEKDSSESVSNYLTGIFEKFSILVNRIPNGFKDTKIYYAIYYNKLVEKGPKNVQSFLNLIFNLPNHIIKDSNWTEFKFYCIQESLLKWETQLKETLRDYQFSLLNDVIKMKDNYTGAIIFPDFSKECIDNQYDKQKVKKICDDFESLLNNCILKDNFPMYFYILEEVYNCISKTEKRNKDVQCDLFSIYIWLFNRACNLANKQFVYIAFDKAKETIKYLDKEKKISNEFGKYIIAEISDCGRGFDSEDNCILVVKVVELLFEFLSEGDELQFVSNSIDRKKELYKGLFNVGVICIENNCDDGLRKVSNALGWLTIYSIKNQYPDELTNYLIGRAGEIYSISKSVGVSSTTLTFLLTLFTTVGAYCCMCVKFKKYISNIINCLKDESIVKIRTAVNMRTSENDMWNELYENRTESVTREFLEKCEQRLKTS